MNNICNFANFPELQSFAMQRRQPEECVFIAGLTKEIKVRNMFSRRLQTSSGKFNIQHRTDKLGSSLTYLLLGIL